MYECESLHFTACVEVQNVKAEPSLLDNIQYKYYWTEMLF